MSQTQTVDEEAIGIDRELAKAVILQILRQSKKAVSRSGLYKIFWLAHLYYMNIAGSSLSAWPIVRVHNGPGIDKGDQLLRELIDCGAIHQEHAARGPFTEVLYQLTNTPIESEIRDKAVEAIRLAVELVELHGLTWISELFHDFSRSWSSTPEGGELNIIIDLIPDGEYEEMKQVGQLWKKAYEELFK